MSTESTSVIGADSATARVPLLASRPRLSAKRLRVVFFPVKLLVGMFFCQGLVGSILVVGWTYRFAQRSIFKYWWTRSGRCEQVETFAQFISATPDAGKYEHWPNWFLRQRGERRPSSVAEASDPRLARAISR